MYFCNGNPSESIWVLIQRGNNFTALYLGLKLALFIIFLLLGITEVMFLLLPFPLSSERQGFFHFHNYQASFFQFNFFSICHHGKKIWEPTILQEDNQQNKILSLKSCLLSCFLSYRVFPTSVHCWNRAFYCLSNPFHIQSFLWVLQLQIFSVSNIFHGFSSFSSVVLYYCCFAIGTLSNAMVISPFNYAALLCLRWTTDTAIFQGNKFSLQYFKFLKFQCATQCMW